MRKEKGGKRGRKRMDDKEKEGEVEERVEVPEERVEGREEEEMQESQAIIIVLPRLLTTRLTLILASQYVV